MEWENQLFVWLFALAAYFHSTSMLFILLNLSLCPNKISYGWNYIEDKQYEQANIERERERDARK